MSRLRETLRSLIFEDDRELLKTICMENVHNWNYFFVISLSTYNRKVLCLGSVLGHENQCDLSRATWVTEGRDFFVSSRPI